MSIKSQVWKTKPHSSQSLSVTLDAFHDKSGIKKGLCSRTFYVGDYKLIIQGVLCQSYYRNPINRGERRGNAAPYGTSGGPCKWQDSEGEGL